MKIEWENIHTVNIKSLDEEHRGLVKIINDFFETKDDDFKKISEILEKLKKYGATHLKHEEELFEEYDYPDPEKTKHIKEHQNYLIKIEELYKKYEQKDPNIKNEMTEFLGQWWIYHINNVDINYSKFLNQKGVH